MEEGSKRHQKDLRNLNKYTYKVLILLLKFIPYIIATGYALATFAGFWLINLIFLGYLIHLSVLSWIFLFLSSIVFRFCSYHRLPLYYIALNDTLVVLDTYIGIPLEIMPLLMLHSGIVGLFILLYIYLKLKT